jgi:hypothetical protein
LGGAFRGVEGERRRTKCPEDTLGLLEFAPSDESVWKASFAAANAVYDYFEIDASPESALSEVVGLRAP